MDKVNFNYKSPANLKEKKSKMVDELLNNSKIRKIIDELDISMEEINDNLGKFIIILESEEECANCNKKECKYAKKGMVPYLIRDEFNELNLKYTLCDIVNKKRIMNLNYLYKDFDNIFNDFDFLKIDPTVISASEMALKNNLSIITKLMKLSQEEISKNNNFVLLGKRGSGKTSYCVALTNTYVNNNHKCAYVDIRKFMNMLLAKIATKDNDGYQEAINTLSEVEILVIDNLGDEKISDWSRTILCDVLSSRNRTDKMTIITSSHSYEDLESLYSSIKGDTNFKANKIKAQDLINQIRTLCKNTFILRSE